MIDARLLLARLDFLEQLLRDRPIDPLFDNGHASAIGAVRHFVEGTVNAPTLAEVQEAAEAEYAANHPTVPV